MDVQEIKEVAKELMVAFKESELTSFSINCEVFELQLGKEVNVIATPQVSYVETAPQMVQPTNRSVAGDQATATTEIEANKAVGTKVIKAPLVGTFYSAEGPNAKPFVEVGSYVHKGDVVCIVEAMKLMNEVESEVEGEVLEILVNNEDMVEYNQPLIVLK